MHRYGNEVRVLTRGPGTIFGEIGLLALSPDDVSENASSRSTARSLKVALRALPAENLAQAIPTGVRTATCSALNYLELARLGRADFLEMVRQFPVLRRRLVEQSLEIAPGRPSRQSARGRLRRAGSLRGPEHPRARHGSLHALRRMHQRMHPASTARNHTACRSRDCCAMADALAII